MMDFPNSPTPGQQYTYGLMTWVWDGIAWSSVPNVPFVIQSDTPPSSPIVGQFWWRGTNGKTYVWTDDGNSKQWVEIGASAQANTKWEFITEVTLTGQTTYDFLNLGGYNKLKLHGTLTPAANAAVGLRLSRDGTTFYAGASDYAFQSLVVTGSTVAASTNAAVSFCYLSGTQDASSILQLNHQIENFNVSGAAALILGMSRGRQTGVLAEWQFASNIQAAQGGPWVAARLVNAAGAAMTGTIALEGWRS